MDQRFKTPEDLAAVGMRVILVNNESSWTELYSRLLVASWISFDTETTCLDPLAHNFKVVGMSFAVDDVTGYYIPLNHCPPRQRMLFDLGTMEPIEPIVQLPEKMVIEKLKPLLETRQIVGHGLKFDYQAVKCKYGIVLRNIVYDTLAASNLLDERGSHGLKDLTEHWLGYKPVHFEQVADPGEDTETDRKAESHFDTVPLKKAALYAAPDAVNPVRLRNAFRPELMREERFIKLLQIEIPLIARTAEMELVGTNLDTEHLRRISIELDTETSKIAQDLRAIAHNPELNPASTQQMVELVYEKMKAPKLVRSKEKGSSKGLFERNTREKLLVAIREDKRTKFGVGGEWMKADVLRLLETYQHWVRLTKLNGVYTTSLIDIVSDDGRLHTLFNQFGARSGRFSSSQPNFQNIPRNTDPKDPAYKYDIRKAFRADPGWVYVLADYSAMEMRIAAGMADDQVMKNIVMGVSKDAVGEPIDIHLYTAAAAFNLNYDEAAAILRDKKNPRYAEIKEYRQKAKPVNFGILYGMTEFGLAADLGETVEFARAVIAGFMRAYERVAAWMKRIETYLRAHLYTETYMGRRRRATYQEMHEHWAFQKAFRACLNHTIQGTGADIVKLSMNKIADEIQRLGLKARMVGQVHDEVIIHCPEPEYETVARMMLKQMESEVNGVPLVAEAEVKRTWSKLEEPLWKLGA